MGLGDPITASEISPDQRVGDGLPQALEEDIEFYGFDHFKIELSGREDWDLDRLSRLAVLLNQICRRGHRVSHKNCKGVFKSLVNRALACRLNAESDKGGYFQTGEDLATVAVIAFEQRTPLEAWSFDLLRMESEVASREGRSGDRELEGA